MRLSFFHLPNWQRFKKPQLMLCILKEYWWECNPAQLLEDSLAIPIKSGDSAHVPALPFLDPASYNRRRASTSKQRYS